MIWKGILNLILMFSVGYLCYALLAFFLWFFSQDSSWNDNDDDDDEGGIKLPDPGDFSPVVPEGPGNHLDCTLPTEHVYEYEKH